MSVAMLTGAVVDLIPFDARHQDTIFAYWQGESRVRTSMGEHLLLSAGQMQTFWRVWTETTPQQQGGVPFLLRDKAGQVIGLAALNRTHATHRTGEIGIEIGAGHWGRGCGTDALLLLTEFAFDWLDLRRVTLNTLGSNARMRHVAERCDDALEVTQRRAVPLRGTWHDITQYGVLRASWAGRATLLERLNLG